MSDRSIEWRVNALNSQIEVIANAVAGLEEASEQALFERDTLLESLAALTDAKNWLEESTVHTKKEVAQETQLELFTPDVAH